MEQIVTALKNPIVLVIYVTSIIGILLITVGLILYGITGDDKKKNIFLTGWTLTLAAVIAFLIMKAIQKLSHIQGHTLLWIGVVLLVLLLLTPIIIILWKKALK